MRTKRVVFVDAEPYHRVICGAILEYYGYRVHLAVSGDEAIDLCRRRAPDLVVLDLSVPGLAGSDVLPRLREQRGAALPVVAFLPAAVEQDRELRSGFTELVPKPSDPRQLLELVQRLIGPPGEGPRSA